MIISLLQMAIPRRCTMVKVAV